jgi:Zn ribbon nucleic-acid-binding protein
MPLSCKHPQVRVVAREEDVEFVECQTCGEVFDSAEFVDILNEDDSSESLGAQGDEA